MSGIAALLHRVIAKVRDQFVSVEVVCVARNFPTCLL